MNKKERLLYQQINEEQEGCQLADHTCQGWYELHHVYRGKNRKNSTKYKMIVKLCDKHHDSLSPAQDLYLKQMYQKKFQQEFPDEDFMSIFRRNYL